MVLSAGNGKRFMRVWLYIIKLFMGKHIVAVSGFGRKLLGREIVNIVNGVAGLISGIFLSFVCIEHISVNK